MRKTLQFFFFLEVCVGEEGWGAAAGWGRAAPSRSWMTWRWSQTRRFPAQRTSFARRSRLPRISRSYCERLRRTNTTGQQREQRLFIIFISSSPGSLLGLWPLLCSVSFRVQRQLFFHYVVLPSLLALTLSRCYDPALCHCVPAPTASSSPLMEQTMWTKRRCASSQAQPRMFQHAGALGWEGPLSPAASRPPVPWPRLLVLWPLSLPPRHSFLFLSVTKRPTHPLGLSPPLLTSLPCSVPCSRRLTFISQWLILYNNMQLCKVAPLHAVDFICLM